MTPSSKFPLLEAVYIEFRNIRSFLMAKQVVHHFEMSDNSFISFSIFFELFQLQNHSPPNSIVNLIPSHLVHSTKSDVTGNGYRCFFSNKSVQEI